MEETFSIELFDGEKKKIDKIQFEKLKPELLATGKFLLINGEIVNISTIKKVQQIKPFKNYTV